MFDQAQRRLLRFLCRALLAMAALLASGLLVWATRSGSTFDGRLDTRESSAIATLRNLHAAQQQFATAAAIDLDGDGHGEFGTFAELAGVADLRPARPSTTTTHRWQQPRLRPTFAATSEGRALHGDYCFQIWLSTTDGRWVGDGTAAEASGHTWCAYAWPASPNGPRRVFFVDAEGHVLAAANGDRRYCGTDSPVPVDAAMPSGDARADLLPDHRTGRDGRLWSPVP